MRLSACQIVLDSVTIYTDTRAEYYSKLSILNSRCVDLSVEISMLKLSNRDYEIEFMFSRLKALLVMTKSLHIPTSSGCIGDITNSRNSR